MVLELLVTLQWGVLALGMAVLCYLTAPRILGVSTRQEIMEESEAGRGNAAVGIAFFGMYGGLGAILYSSQANSDTILQAAAAMVLGYLLMIAGFFLFELITPYSLRRQVNDHNVQAGWMVAGLFLLVGLGIAGALV
ncbi:MAG: DUF350 domain-containing protein [Bacillota bacterium]